MKSHEEPKVMRDLHKIREQIHREAIAVGEEKYYATLNQKSSWRRRHARKRSLLAVRERGAVYRTAAKRRQ